MLPLERWPSCGAQPRVDDNVEHIGNEVHENEGDGGAQHDALHLGIAILAIGRPPAAPSWEWLVLDPPARLVLLVASSLFLFCSIYAVNYLRRHADRSNAVFCACMLAFLGLMSLVACSHHLGLMWVAIEATTVWRPRWCKARTSV